MKLLQHIERFLNPVGVTRRKIRSSLDMRPQLAPDEFSETYFKEDERIVAKRLMEITAEWCDAEILGLTPDHEFVDDLQIGELDCLDMVEFVDDIEKYFGIKFSDERIEIMRTFKEVVDEIILLQTANKAVQSTPES